MLKFKKDFGASDRTFAINCGMSFKTPDEYFLNVNPEKFELPPKPQCELSNKLKKLEKRLKEIENMLSSGLTMFLCIGYPGSGKSYFGRSISSKFPNLNVCCRDELGSTDKCIRTVKGFLQTKSVNVYIDSTNPGKTIF